jgi:sporulation protein YlmC with PRC-barrel domain
MKTHRVPLWVACLIGVIATAIMLSNRASVPDANAQVAVPPAYQNPVEQPKPPNQYLDRPASATRPLDQNMTAKGGCKASEILGLAVHSPEDKAIGSIKDLMLAKDGKISYAAVSFGGFLGMGDKLFAVPWDAVEIVKPDQAGNKQAYARIDVTEQTLRGKNGFDKDHWPEKADESFRPGGLSQRAASPGLPVTSLSR